MFTSDSVSFLSAFFGGIYGLFTSVVVPGTTVSVFSLSLGIMATVFVIGLIHGFFGIASGWRVRGGNNRFARRQKGDDAS